MPASRLELDPKHPISEVQIHNLAALHYILVHGHKEQKNTKLPRGHGHLQHFMKQEYKIDANINNP